MKITEYTLVFFSVLSLCCLISGFILIINSPVSDSQSSQTSEINIDINSKESGRLLLNIKSAISGLFLCFFGFILALSLIIKVPFNNSLKIGDQNYRGIRNYVDQMRIPLLFWIIRKWLLK